MCLEVSGRGAAGGISRRANAYLSRQGAMGCVWRRGGGDWRTEMRRGVKLEVKDVQGDTVRVQHHGWADGRGWEMKLSPGSKDGKFTLEDTGKFKRSLVVKKV